MKPEPLITEPLTLIPGQTMPFPIPERYRKAAAEGRLKLVPDEPIEQSPNEFTQRIWVEVDGNTVDRLQLRYRSVKTAPIWMRIPGRIAHWIWGCENCRPKKTNPE
jgi:hypothetical protein